jgi:hypothetical protein
MPSLADPILFDALADAVTGTPTERDAITVLAGVSGRPAALAARLLPPVRDGRPLLLALADAEVFGVDDAALLRACAPEAPDANAVAACLRLIAARMRARADRRRSLLARATTPLLLWLLTIALEPLPLLVTTGGYGRAFARGAVPLVVTVALVGALIAAFAARASRRAMLGAMLPLPLIGGLARRHLEAELATAYAPLVAADGLTPLAIAAARSIVEVGPLGRVLADRRPTLEALGRSSSDGLALLLATAAPARRLDARLGEWSAQARAALTRSMGRAITTVLWAILFVESARSLVGLGAGLSNLGGLGGLGGMGGLGGAASAMPLGGEQLELEKIMREGRE